MNPVEIIKKKRDGHELTKDELNFFIKGYIEGKIADYQVAAFLMAGFLKGFSDLETKILTEIMMDSGYKYDFSNVEGLKVDKHSTGGVGDKVSIPLLPVLVSLGFKVPMVSGRGLGHTGGTLDKLESIEGMNVFLSKEKMYDMVEKIGGGFGGQTENFVPADKLLYSLRDVTGTVESIPLITSSIMSKKLAEGIDSLILDVKCGNGAFMKNFDDAKKLADNMLSIGEMFDKKMVYLITDMSQVLGEYAGNGCEIHESIKILKGELENDVYKLVKAMAVLLMEKNGIGKSCEDRVEKIKDVIKKGYAYETFLKIVSAQGGKLDKLKCDDLFYQNSVKIVSDRDGYISYFDTYKIGIALIHLNAGRFRKEDNIDHKTGLKVYKKIRDRVLKGDIIFEVFVGNHDYQESVEILKNSFKIEESDENIEKVELIKYIKGV
ncbi:MAG: thymidine phosphorylase [candidate division WOR-3 bacterium]